MAIHNSDLKSLIVEYMDTPTRIIYTLATERQTPTSMITNLISQLESGDSGVVLSFVYRTQNGEFDSWIGNVYQKLLENYYNNPELSLRLDLESFCHLPVKSSSNFRRMTRQICNKICEDLLDSGDWSLTFVYLTSYQEYYTSLDFYELLRDMIRHYKDEDLYEEIDLFLNLHSRYHFTIMDLFDSIEESDRDSTDEEWEAFVDF